MQIMRIHEFKHGPFHEHSSQLYSIAVGVQNWGKVNSGLFKMYQVCVHSSFGVTVVTNRDEGGSAWKASGRAAYPLGGTYGVGGGNGPQLVYRRCTTTMS